MNRSSSSTSLHSSHSSQVRLIAGLVAGLLGGLLSSLIVNPPPGFLLNLLISAALGALFGLLLGNKIRSVGNGFIWGEAFGLFWWLIGTLTLIPILSGQGLYWTLPAAQAAFPFLIAQMVANGAILGVIYYFAAQQVGKIMPTQAVTPLASESESKEQPPMRKVPMGQAIVPPLVQRVIIGLLGGIFGSWVFLSGIDPDNFLTLIAGLAGGESVIVGRIVHYLIGSIIGVTFAIFFSQDIKSSGSGLIWGMNYGLFWWMMGPQTLLPILRFGELPTWSLEGAQALIGSLVAHLLYGSLVGLFVATMNKLWNVLFVDSDPLHRNQESAGARGLRGILMGQAGGIIGGLLFTIVMVGVGALSNVASLVGAESVIAGFIVHLLIAITIGTTYGLLFQRQAYSYGAGMAWGLLYGVLWWLIGTNTLFNVLLGLPVDWSLAAIASRYPALVGHLLYGAGLGLFYQYLARRYDSDLITLSQKAQQAKRPLSSTAAPALWAVALTLGVMLPLLLAGSNIPESDSPSYGLVEPPSPPSPLDCVRLRRPNNRRGGSKRISAQKCNFFYSIT